MDSLEQRIKNLEEAFEEVKKLKGIPGSRGPAGSIDSAVANARAALTADLSASLKKVEADLATAVARCECIDGGLRQYSETVRSQLSQITSERVQAFRKNLENELAAVLIPLLEEYGVVSNLDNQVIKA